MGSLFMKIIGTMHLNEESYHPISPSIGTTITQSPTIIGSQLLYPVNIVINEPGVSRRQTEIFFKDDAWYLNDMGSDNGTWILRENITKKNNIESPKLIEQQMLVLLGTVVVEFQEKEDSYAHQIRN